VPLSFFSDSASNQPRAASGCPSAPNSGAISASARPEERPRSQEPISVTVGKWLRSASTRKPEILPNACSLEVRPRPPWNSSAPKRVRAGSFKSKLAMGAAATSMRVGAIA
jgi:hypothetical protein